MHGAVALSRGGNGVDADPLAMQQRGDIDTFVEREAPGLLDYFLRRAATREDAADLLGEALLVVWRRQGSIPEDEVPARMWLFGVARNMLATHRRAQGRRIALADRLRCELSSMTAAALSDTEAVVRAMVGELAERDREIVGLVYWEGFSLEEVARILGMRAATVRSRHFRLRARLRARLIEEGIVDD